MTCMTSTQDIIKILELLQATSGNIESITFTINFRKDQPVINTLNTPEIKKPEIPAEMLDAEF